MVMVLKDVLSVLIGIDRDGLYVDHPVVLMAEFVGQGAGADFLFIDVDCGIRGESADFDLLGEHSAFFKIDAALVFCTSTKEQ
jgi:hypothetical protein